MKHKHFVFETYEFNKTEKKLFLKYSLDEKVHFTETIYFDFDLSDKFNEEALQKAFFGLWIMAGISYFKATLPPKIIIKKHSLSKKSADFFSKIYTHGLGEFFYENNVDPTGKINFPSAEKSDQNSVSLPELSGTLLPIGGGKDSLVSAQILEESGQDFTPWIVGGSAIQDECCELLQKNPLKILRTLDPQLFELNKNGALNGHVPISAILAFLGVCTAILTSKKHIALSNESSASEANTIFHGFEINHQYSKSLEFEQDFQSYVTENISPDIQYFSLLRPWTELKIAEVFAKKCWNKYKNTFSSCNRNFTIQKDKLSTKWCCKCPKCAFVFLIFAPFLEPKELIDIFGENLFQKPELKTTFEELLGLHGHKPFECVGETNECRAAAFMALEKYPELQTFTQKLKNPPIFSLNAFHKHALPQNFHDIMKSLST